MIFDKIIKDLLQLNFFSEYKFRKRDSSFLLKTKGGKQFIEMDHWIDEATSSLVIYPIYGVRFDILGSVSLSVSEASSFKPVDLR